MRRPNWAVSAALAVALGAAVAGCGEKPQSGVVRKGDVAPSQGGGPAGYMASGWKAGDAVSWEAHLKARSQSQNEYARTGAR